LQKDVIPFVNAYKATLPADRRVLFDRYELVDAAFKVVGVGSVGDSFLHHVVDGGRR
jgi:Uncharacterized protein conserved in bacteria (DUF2252)